jgi:DNA-binding LacI/PurR family transcriptional regulator
MSATVTIADVATRANVSKATVSRVLNRPEIVSEETITRVQTAMETLRFRPNRHARALNGFRNKTVGLLFFDEMRALFQNSFWGEATSTVYEHLFQAGFECNLIALGERAATGERFRSGDEFVEFLDTRSVDGFVLVGNVSASHEELLARSETRSVMWGQPSNRSLGIPYVDSDSVEGAAAAVRYLADSGRTTIATITAPMSLSAGRDRYEGYRQGLAEVGRSPQDDLIAHGDFTETSGHAAMESLLTQNALIDAVFVANDEMALGAIQLIRDRGLRVPQDIAVVGYDNSPQAELAEVRLTTVAPPYNEIGAELVSALTRAMSGEAAVSRLFKPTLTLRDSA